MRVFLLYIFMIILIYSCSSESRSAVEGEYGEVDVQEAYTQSDFFCVWAYGVAGERPVQMQMYDYFDRKGVDLQMEDISLIGSLYLALYFKYRDADRYTALVEQIRTKHENELVLVQDGCIEGNETVHACISMIETLKYDWNGMPVQ